MTFFAHRGVILALSILSVLLTGFFIFQLFLKKPEINLLSPVLGVTTNIYADNIWFPNESTYNYLNDANAPIVTATSAIFVDPDSGEILYQKNPQQRIHVASLIKIMTAIVSLENKDMDQMFDVSSRAAEMEPDKMYLKAGEKISLQNLLNGIFLISANDASEVIAEGTLGNREEFIKLMNKKARELGMNDTLFINPSGLEEDGRDQYSTALDTLLMSHFAINQFPELLNISSQPELFIERSATHQDYMLYSGINLLTTYPGVKGFKTGYTPTAGLTLVTYAEKDGKKVLGVLLNCTNRRDDAKALLDYSFTKLGI